MLNSLCCFFCLLFFFKHGKILEQMGCLMKTVENCYSSRYMCVKFSKKYWLALTQPTFQAPMCCIFNLQTRVKL